MASTEAQRLEAVRYRIETLLQLVREGMIRVPAFQRDLRWSERDVHRLFDSIYRGYPIGTLLFWERSASAGQVTLGPVSVTAPEQEKASWVVDGQQRVTSLAASLLGDGVDTEDQRFRVSFDLANEQFVRTRASDPDTRIPVRGAFDLQTVMAWVRERNLVSLHQDRAFRLADRLRNYEIPAYKVEASDEQALREIFDRTNTFGKRMTKAEVFRALNTSSDPQADLKSLANDIAAQGFGELEGNTLVYCVLATRGPDVLREFRGEFDSSSDSVKAFQATSEAILRTIAFLRDHADVPHFDLVPYQHQTVGLARFFALHPEPDHHVLTLLRRWFWRAAELGPLPKKGNTGTLRAAGGAIVAGDSYKSVETLLEIFDGQRPEFDLGNFRWTASSTRMAVCALARLQPRSANESAIDITEAIEMDGREALRPIVAHSGSRLELTLANRVFVAPTEHGSDSEAADALTNAPESIRKGHAISESAHAALMVGDAALFLEARLGDIKTLTNAFLASRSEWEVALRPSIEQLVSDG